MSNEIMEASSDGATLYLTRTLLDYFLLVRYIYRHLHSLRGPRLKSILDNPALMMIN